MRAVKAAFVEIRTPKFSKKVQIDPYLEDSATCNMCQIQQGPYFCRELPVGVDFAFDDAFPQDAASG